MPDDGSLQATGQQRRYGRGSGGVTGRGFRPGQSGNSAGRVPKDVVKLAREHTAEAIAALVAALKSPRERVAAASVLLARGWGQPKLPLEAEGSVQWVIRIPAEPQSVEAWLETYAPAHIKEAKRLEKQKASGEVIDATPSRKVIDVPREANDDAAK